MKKSLLDAGASLIAPLLNGVKRRKRDLGKPEMCDFLGFTDICETTRRNRRFTLVRRTMRERVAAKSPEVKRELRR